MLAVLGVNAVLHFQRQEDDADENDENLDYDSDFDDLEELLSELIRHKVSETMSVFVMYS